MTWQLRDASFRNAIASAVEATAGQCALAGTVGTQLHVAAEIGIDKLGPPAHAIEIVSLGAPAFGLAQGSVPIKLVDALGFEPSVQARRVMVELEGQS